MVGFMYGVFLNKHEWLDSCTECSWIITDGWIHVRRHDTKMPYDVIGIDYASWWDVPTSKFYFRSIYMFEHAIRSCQSLFVGCAGKKKQFSSILIPTSAMKSCARHCRQLVYISSVLILILSAVESSSFNDNFQILWGNRNVRLLNNGQTAQLTMDRASGTVIFLFYQHRQCIEI